MNTTEPKNIGVINPYALTEVITGRKINWQDDKAHHLIEEVLETDYDKLFDPKFDSPLYAGLKLPNDGKAEKIDTKDVELRDESISPDISSIKKIGQLSKLGVKDVKNLKVNNSFLKNGNLNLNLKIPKLDNTLTSKRVSKLMKELCLPDEAGNKNTEWKPDNVKWMDKGDFVQDVTEYDDPIQGAVGNCYFIAALAAVAWAKPYLISHRNRPIGPGETDRTNMIKLYSKGGGKNAPTDEVEVTDKVPVSRKNSRYIYCRSNDNNEIWPALYEKAFAKWITKNNTDEPNISATAGGNPVQAMAQLCDKKPYYYSTNNCYRRVRENCRSRRTFNPMITWTYPSGKNYRGSNIAANHAYTILGWAYHNNQKYIVLRNPWGVFEPTGLTTYHGLFNAYDISFWEHIHLLNNDGVFALKAQSFEYYFAGLGVVK